MSQNDMSISNADGATVRADLNSALQALASNNSGATAPGTTYAYQWWVDTADGVLKQRNAANSAWVVRASLGETFVVSKSALFTAVIGDTGKTFLCTNSWTLSLDPAATLGDGWRCTIINTGVGTITVDPNGAEQIDGASTLAIGAGESATIHCNGSSFRSSGRTANLFAGTVTFKDGGDVASAASLTLGTGNIFNITGTTAITSIGTKGIGTLVVLRFDGVLTLTHHATDLVLGASITTAAGDFAILEEYATGDWRLVNYHRASGGPIWEYVSTDQTIVAGSMLTLPHGLGVAPGDIKLWLKNATPEHGWTAGQEIEWSAGGEGGYFSYSPQVRRDATNIYVYFPSTAPAGTAIHATSFTQVTLTAGNWKLVVRARP